MGKLEVIVLNAEDAKMAEAYGADRLELVTAIGEGGLTPSYGTVKQVINSVKIPVMVMLRPHSYSYQYHQEEWATMKEDLHMIRGLGAAGIVFGALTKDTKIDFQMLGQVMEELGDLSITFHRAIDEEHTEALYQSLCQSPYRINQVLTSGGQQTAVEGLATIQSLVQYSSQSPNYPLVMPGSGLNVHNIDMVHQALQAPYYHFGSGVRKEGDFGQMIDGNILTKIKEMIK
ncbi:copper homeostasis protein CutC [Lysinibacillus piscis]|uniref:PF03932 family protein CutC n=1 Tax=Lysinibacillus piscis TaxID=2518931 RepID=A0ABQ5NG25_9BACI|nr:copper homeostasis protein CutC [Lysinibacillus sp. KH24]GLC87301.1 copper homeostasis protein CutC [Lysinibacillus sp. KH24]